MQRPFAHQRVRIEQKQLRAVVLYAIDQRHEKPEEAVVFENRWIKGGAMKQRTFQAPFVGKVDSRIDFDGSVEARLRDHEELAAITDDLRIRTMIGPFNHRDRLPQRTVFADLEAGDAALVRRVAEIFDEEVTRAVVRVHERIGVVASGRRINSLIPRCVAVSPCIARAASD